MFDWHHCEQFIWSIWWSLWHHLCWSYVMGGGIWMESMCELVALTPPVITYKYSRATVAMRWLTSVSPGEHVHLYWTPTLCCCPLLCNKLRKRSGWVVMVANSTYGNELIACVPSLSINTRAVYCFVLSLKLNNQPLHCNSRLSGGIDNLGAPPFFLLHIAPDEGKCKLAIKEAIKAAFCLLSHMSLQTYN